MYVVITEILVIIQVNSLPRGKSIGDQVSLPSVLTKPELLFLKGEINVANLKFLQINNATGLIFITGGKEELDLIHLWCF